jgi:hypothetical protein
VSDKEKERKTNFLTVCATALDLINNFLKRSVRRPQNPNFNVGRERKYEKMKLVPAVTYIESMGRVSAVANRKAKISFGTPVLRHVIRLV